VIGAQYEQAEDGSQACARIAAGEQFDCVLLDNQMPEMCGAEATRELRAMGFTGLIVGMTGDPIGCEERAKFEAAGLDACVDKDSEGVRRAVLIMREHAAETAASSASVWQRSRNTTGTLETLKLAV